MQAGHASQLHDSLLWAHSLLVGQQRERETIIKMITHEHDDDDDDAEAEAELSAHDSESRLQQS